MSRSRKKVPIASPVVMARAGEKALRFFKTRANRKLRRIKDVADGCSYKKHDERRTWPDDGKIWHGYDYPKLLRK